MLTGLQMYLFWLILVQESKTEPGYSDVWMSPLSPISVLLSPVLCENFKCENFKCIKIHCLIVNFIMFKKGKQKKQYQQKTSQASCLLEVESTIYFLMHINVFYKLPCLFNLKEQERNI